MFKKWFGPNTAGRKKKAWQKWVEDRTNWAETKFRGMGKPTEFFPYNLGWVLPAKFVPDVKEIVVDTSKNRPRNETLAGRLVFHNFELQVQEIGSSKGLFVAYTDTSEFCYPGGKYLNIPRPEPNETIIVDFNYAYSALCYYGNNYDCPLPSRENRLNFEIKAGQKTV